jgi:hypothetical protein
VLTVDVLISRCAGCGMLMIVLACWCVDMSNIEVTGERSQWCK